MEAVINPKRVKRRHSEEFKQSVVAACSEAGASIAGVALSHGLNANLARKWMIERGVVAPRRRHPSEPALQRPTLPTASSPAFIPVGVECSRSAPSNIQIQMRRGGTALTVSWPIEAAGSCAAWLGEYLR